MTSDGALRVYQASIQPPIGPLTQMQLPTALFVLRPNLPEWLEEADTTITRLGGRTNDDRTYFDDCILKQSLCSTTVITAKAAAKLLATACCCCFQTAVALLWTYEVTSTEVPIRLLRKLRRRCMALFTTFWNPHVRRPGVISELVLCLILNWLWSNADFNGVIRQTSCRSSTLFHHQGTHSVHANVLSSFLFIWKILTIRKGAQAPTRTGLWDRYIIIHWEFFCWRQYTCFVVS